MKRPRKPTRAEKIFLSKKKLKAENWSVQSEDQESIVFVNKSSGKTRKFEKPL